MTARLLTLFAVFLQSVFCAALAAEFKSGKHVTVAASDTLKGDFYAAAEVVRILGTAAGDVVAAGRRIELEGVVAENLYAAGRTVLIDGTVRGDILALGADVEISGSAEGGIRAAAGSVFIEGTVNGDVVCAGGEIFLSPNAVISGDLVVASDAVEVAGTVHGKLTGSADRVVLAGTVDHDIELRVGKELELQPAAQVRGDLVYRSRRPLQLQNPEAVEGEIVYIEVEPEEGGGWLGWVGRIWFWLATLAVGLIVVWLARPQVVAALDRTLNRPLPTLGSGAIALIGMPIAVLVSFLLIVLIPFGLILLAAYFIFGYVGLILSGAFLGQQILRLLGERRDSPYLALVAGVTALFLLALVPLLGDLIWLLGVVVGFGMVGLGLVEGFQRRRQQPVVVPGS